MADVVSGLPGGAHRVGGASIAASVMRGSARQAALVRLVRRLVEHGGSTESIEKCSRALRRILDLDEAEVRLVPPGNEASSVVPPRECFVLARGGELFGVLTVFRATGLEDQDRALLTEFAAGLSVAIYVGQVNQRLRRISEELIEARAEERRRLRADLHDRLGPILTASAMRIDSLRRLPGTAAAGFGQPLQELHGDLVMAIAEVRRIVHELEPAGIVTGDLRSILQAHASRFERATGGRLRVVLQMSDELHQLSVPVRLAAFHIVGEALANVAGHARASTCTVRLSVDTDLRIEVLDDGVGVPATCPPGVGLASIRRRAEDLGGECTVERRQPGGTRVCARLPVSGHHPDANGWSIDANTDRGRSPGLPLRASEPPECPRVGRSRRRGDQWRGSGIRSA